ncbi:MAG: hypothetical protein WC631_00415 [Candidatus Paceibacterota bacterium]|jgi:hypothetical protein
MKKKIVLIVCLAVIILIAVFWSSESNYSIVADYKDATYLIDGREVQLTNGLAEEENTQGSASKTIIRYFGNKVAGDFNGDGTNDTAFLLTQNTGGSGTFFYIAVALGDGDGYKGANAILLGDRIAPQTTEFRDGKIIVNYADRKADESFAVRPSIGVSRYFEISDDKLVEASSK